MSEPGGQRWVVVGTTGSGKTTVARHIAATLALPHIELDALHWNANWIPTPREDFRARVASALVGERWVVDGNYSMARDLVWGGADTLIWLDYAFPVVFTHLLARTLRRVVRREVLWNGNRETVANAFFSRDSVLIWAWQTHWKNQRTLPGLLAQSDYAHLTVLRFCSPRATKTWMASLSSPS